MNPFFNTYGTPFDTPPFDRISVPVLEEAVMEGIRQEDEEVRSIAENPASPTFANTIAALDAAGDLLDRATTVMYNLSSAETSDELDALTERLSPVLSEHANNIALNARLFERVRAVRDAVQGGAVGLTAEDRMLLDKTYEGFERSGATLSATDKQRLRKLTAELSQLTLRFQQNHLKETNDFRLEVTDKAQLGGLPESQLAQAAQAARDLGLQGWVFTLHAPSYGPFMKYAENRDLRQRLYMAYNTQCTHDNDRNNFAIVSRIVDLRRELAQLLGYPTYADYALKRRMAETTPAVQGLLADLVASYLPVARQEVEAVAARAAADGVAPLMPWDFPYYSHRLYVERYDFDGELLRPYFELSRVRQGVFSLAERLYGIRFRENTDIPVYHPDVTAYEVRDADDSLLGILYTDFHPRPGKQSGAWMTNYREQREGVRPVVSVVMNFTKPTADKPALLTHGELETFLHEFGHALHGLFSDVHYGGLSGTNVFWDFVELPSQFMENYAVEPEFLRTFAVHYETGEPLPQEYIDKIRHSRTFQAAYACIRQVSFGLLDMAYYTLSQPLEDDVRTFERQAWAPVQLLPAVPEACMSVQFGHIMSGGYAAGYYSYKWAEVLDADAFSLFQERGIFNTETARSFRSNILSRGATEHPMTLYVRFRGRKPTIAALKRRDGINSDQPL